jgi:hypothetical protein
LDIARAVTLAKRHAILAVAGMAVTGFVLGFLAAVFLYEHFRIAAKDDELARLREARADQEVSLELAKVEASELRKSLAELQRAGPGRAATGADSDLDVMEWPLAAGPAWVTLDEPLQWEGGRLTVAFPEAPGLRMQASLEAKLGQAYLELRQPGRPAEEFMAKQWQQKVLDVGGRQVAVRVTDVGQLKAKVEIRLRPK